MTKKWIGINLLLLLLAAITGRQLYVSIRQFEADNDLSKIQPDRALNQKIAQEMILPPPLQNSRYTVADFAVIPAKNIFSESRTSEDSSDNTVPSGTMSAAQKPILVGIILSENQKIASILEPRRRGRNSEAQFKKIGDEYQGYTITDIASDHIVLESGGQKEIITLEDSSQSARRGRPASLPIQVFSIGGGAATNNIPFSFIAGRTGASQSPPASSARTVNPGTNNNARNNVPLPGIVPSGGQQPETNPQENAPQQENTERPKSQPPVPTPGGVQRDPRVIRTPFGDILRPDP